MSSYRYGRPTLRSSVDVQLQSAFSDGNWNAVVRLATKRAATFKDPYYEAIKMCAESQLDGTAEKCGVLVAIDELIKSKKTPDIDTVELYEWACRDFLGYEIEYAETLGPLRARWAKANPTSPLAVQCLQACLEKWDLVSAQQIATTLDKTHTNSTDRRYLFWNITLTFLLSVSPQCTDASRKVYSLLAVRQLERAADLTENSPKLEPTDRGLLTEEEICLYYRVLLSHGTKEEFISRLQSPKLGAISQLKQGHKLLLCEGLDALEKWGEWDHIYNICRDALTLDIDGGTTPFFVCDLQIWKKFAAAASKAADPDNAIGEVQVLLKRFIDIKDKASEMYKKNLSLALLETTFRLPVTTLNPNHDSTGLSPRVVQIGLFLDQYFERLAAFDDIKGYVADLGFEEAKALLENVVPRIVDEKTDKARKIVLKVLDCKLRYLLTTCPQTLLPQPSVADGETQDEPFQCRFCANPTSPPCKCCLKNIVVGASSTYKQITSDTELLEAIPRLDKDPRLDLALVMGTSFLKLSGLQPRTSDAVRSLWQDIEPGSFLQAVLLLDHQLKVTPSDNELRLLLVQLYLILGCPSYAYQLWIPLDVKRTIQDALSPLFFDRLSSISPGLFQGSRSLMEPLRTYYNNTLRDDCPLRIWDAFSSGSYTSILDITEYDSNLRKSCTLMMSLVEERRATRCFGGKMECEIEEHPLVVNITDKTVLVNKTDYGSFPNLESSNGPPIHEYLRLGPGLSNERAHLAFLSEQYLDLLAYKPPKEYKPSKANEAALRDREYIAEVLSRLSNSLADVFNRPSTPAHLTGSETSYYSIVSLLPAAVLTCVSTSRTDPPPKQSLWAVTASIKTAFSTLRAALPLLHPVPDARMPQACYALADMQTLSCVRDAALAIRHSTAFVLGLHDKELARDRSGRSGLHRDVLVEMKALGELAGRALAEVKGTVQRLKEALAEGGWLDRLLDLVFGGDGQEGEDEVGRALAEVVEGRAGAEEWAGKVIESWRENLKGWGMVRME
ncbi:N-alpha-acetyltransferase 25, NatB auxiliary subunit [Madurella mycetomatis]|uniref:N-alpha-acetyltransferase 25, NatB auxiliary subunit n=1 Tax=Madurella mycetomatis TaxID=100816 RepID=A0A175W773_9PEZI|nr:N-alpha-acetyltransferase 25, NatB auxiliary subunit [Madurella mycetomatis]